MKINGTMEARVDQMLQNYAKDKSERRKQKMRNETKNAMSMESLLMR